MRYLSAKFQVPRSIPSNVLAIYIKKNTNFKAPSGPWSKSRKNPRHVSNIFRYFTSLQNFRPLGSSISKFQGSKSKVLAIFKKNSFQGPIRPLVQILEKLGTRVKYFWPPAKFQVCWFIHSKVLAIFKKNSFARPHQAPGPNFGKPRDTCQIIFNALHFKKFAEL